MALMFILNVGSEVSEKESTLLLMPSHNLQHREHYFNNN